jgi:cytochrome b pre-mRNA-processing protein 3
MLSALRQLFSYPSFKREAHEAYARLVVQSRQPWFYQEQAVPDTLDGRFDIILLHLFLVIHRLRGAASSDAAEFIRVLSEIFFADMDRNMREMGVGDTGVGVRIKKMAGAFYGRLQAYEQASKDQGAFIECLTRNLYRSEEAMDAQKLLALYQYVQRNMAHLAQLKTEQVLKGSVEFLS